MHFMRLNLGTKLTIGFSVVLVLLAVVTSIGITRLALLNSHLDLVGNQYHKKVVSLSEMRGSIFRIMAAVRNIVIFRDEDLMAKEKARLDAARATYEQHVERFSSLILDEKEKQLQAPILELREKMKPLVDVATALGLENRDDEVRELLEKELNPLQMDFIDGIQKMIAYESDQTDEKVKTGANAYTAGRTVMLSAGALALILGALFAFLVTRSITRPISATVNYLCTFDFSKLDVPLQIDNGDSTVEIVTLVTAFNLMRENLAEAHRRQLSAQREVRESEDKFRFLFDKMTQGVVVEDAEGVIIEANQAACDILGLKMDQLIGKTGSDPHWKLVREDGSPVVPEELPSNVALTTGKPVSNVTLGVYLPETDACRWIITSSVPRFMPGAQTPFATMTTFADITERKRAEEEIRRLQRLLSNIIDSMPSVLVALDVEGKVTQWNIEAEKATGINAPEAAGKPLAAIYPHLSAEMARVMESIRLRQVQSESKIAWKAGGENRYHDLTIYPLIANGVEGAVIRLDDVTERVRLEEMLVQSEKMLSVGGLAAGMAHEINNPLAGILQNAQVMHSRLTEDLPRNVRAAEECGTTVDAVHEYMEKREILPMLSSVIEAGRRCAAIVENMLSFSRKSESIAAPHSLAELIDKTLQLAESDYDMKKKYDFRRISIVREYEADMPLVSCEATKIQQVLLNLLKNGAHAMTGMEDRTPQFTVRLYTRGNRACMEVEDNGRGMDQATRKRVFEPFFTTKEIGVGTGLGLSVSYFIVTENHGGTIEVESEPGRGSRFIICLPLERSESV